MAYRKLEKEDYKAKITSWLFKWQTDAHASRNKKLYEELGKLMDQVNAVEQDHPSTPKYTDAYDNPSAYLSRDEWAATYKK